LIKLFARNIDSIRIFFSLDNQDGWNDFKLVLFDKSLGKITSGIGDDAEFHIAIMSLRAPEGRVAISTNHQTGDCHVACEAAPRNDIIQPK
jgi:hypothetical protein